MGIIFSGVLRTISGGEERGRDVLRSFIDIGDSHIRNVFVNKYHDELLMTVVGQEVALSVTTNMDKSAYFVYALRMPDGRVVRKDFYVMVFELLGQIALCLGIALVGLIVLLIGFASLWSWKNPLIWIGSGLIIFGIILALKMVLKHLRAFMDIKNLALPGPRR